MSREEEIIRSEFEARKRAGDRGHTGASCDHLVEIARGAGETALAEEIEAWEKAYQEKLEAAYQERIRAAPPPKDPRPTDFKSLVCVWMSELARAKKKHALAEEIIAWEKDYRAKLGASQPPEDPRPC